MVALLQQTWSWWVSGTLIASTMFALIFFGKTFGFSSNLRHICSAAGAGKHIEFFNYNWREHKWNLVFLAGAIIGGFVGHHFLTANEAINISQATIQDLSKLGFKAPVSIQPDEIYSWEQVLTIKGFSILAISGLMIGFGTRYAGGCTSGHAISGLSNLQLPSLLAVIGFFIGGIFMTFFILPFIF